MYRINKIAERTAYKIVRYQETIKQHQTADDRLSALLEARYGKKRMGDMRYRPAETVEILEAMTAKLKASEAQQTAWLAYQKENDVPPGFASREAYLNWLAGKNGQSDTGISGFQKQDVPRNRKGMRGAFASGRRNT